MNLEFRYEKAIMKKRSTAKKENKGRKRNTTGRKTRTTKQESFPGYPPYPPHDDIMHQSERVNGDVEDVLNKVYPTGNVSASQDGSELSKDDLEALSEQNIRHGDDEELRKRTTPVDFAGDDLDVPGAELDDESESRGSEDEENNLYSLGGDDQDDDRS
jgi:hypothetical protein